MFSDFFSQRCFDCIGFLIQISLICADLFFNFLNDFLRDGMSPEWYDIVGVNMVVCLGYVVPALYLELWVHDFTWDFVLPPCLLLTILLQYLAFLQLVQTLRSFNQLECWYSTFMTPERRQ